jgi:predicted transcriptional regulator
MTDQDNPNNVPELTAEIVSSYVAHHDVAVGDLPRLITLVGRELAGLGQEPEAPARPEPAVSIRRSVRPDHLVCLVCGQRLKTLRRHLQAAHGLTPQAYRETFGLRPDYPMVAPNYALKRQELAKKIGLGRKPKAK